MGGRVIKEVPLELMQILPSLVCGLLCKPKVSNNSTCYLLPVIPGGKLYREECSYRRCVQISTQYYNIMEMATYPVNLPPFHLQGDSAARMPPELLL